jgi:ATP-dependent Lhr-like helicase
MTSIRGDKIYAKPIRDPTGSIPSWVGEEIPVPFEVAQEVGAIRRKVETSLNRGMAEEDIATELSQVYPASPETMKRALNETFEQAQRGDPVPTDKRILLEDWEDFVIINSHFGLMVNRTLARLIGHLLSEEVGATIGVQQDPYRIVIQTSGSANAMKVSRVIQQLSNMDLENLIREASKKSGIFKRRMVHVAKRFGAITRYADFQSIKLRQVMKSLEGTVIMEEAFKETLEKDLDMQNTKRILAELGQEIELSFTPPQTGPTPIARIGIERISRKTDLIPPEKMKRILIESTKVRILNEARLLVCITCPDFAKILTVKNMPNKFECPKCHGNLGISAETPERIEKIRKKRGRALSESEQRLMDNLENSSKLLQKYGKIAACIFAGRRLTPTDAKAILRRTRRLSDRLFELIMEQERKALRRRFW